MCMHWLKYVRLNRKDWLKNMLGTKLEVGLLADVSEAHSAILLMFTDVLLGPSDMSLHHSSWMYLTLIHQQKRES